jgi:hypothetical protein
MSEIAFSATGSALPARMIGKGFEVMAVREWVCLGGGSGSLDSLTCYIMLRRKNLEWDYGIGEIYPMPGRRN